MQTRALTIHVAVEDAQAYETASAEVQKQVETFLREKLREAMRNQASRDTSAKKTAGDLGWPEGFFTKVAGGWQGEPLKPGERQDDLPFSNRVRRRSEGGIR